jgi:hypothetical protein
VAQLLSAPGNGLVVERFESRLRGFDEERFYLWRVGRSPAGDLARGEKHDTPPAAPEV